ncbi:MAG: hypothetical protein WDM89_10150 [Rhizomicrobium sp.]
MRAVRHTRGETLGLFLHAFGSFARFGDRDFLNRHIGDSHTPAHVHGAADEIFG